MRIAVVGCGEVGTTYARALVDGGAHELVLCDPAPGAALAKWAREHDVPLHESLGPWLAQVQRAWVCVAGELAHDVVRGLVDHLPVGAVVVDLTTASPADKRRSADAAAGRTGYVDAVIMGAVGLTGAATPLLVAGPPAGLEGLEDLGAPVRHLPAAGPGDAAALKLLRSVLTKGLEALGVECLLAAEELGVRHELASVLADIDEGGLTPFVEAVVRSHPQHAARRRHEVARAAHQLADSGRPSPLLREVEARFAGTAEAAAGDPPTTTSLDDALAWLATTTRTTDRS
ncbi:NAD(P)-binding domain-containing protein [Janibacter terrae]|uniref:NAD(P)-binding domain-containing protein n=1 Tax=Janibacter terrae TaxID=103817 RepID=A0ABZ2FD01_9MICO